VRQSVYICGIGEDGNYIMGGYAGSWRRTVIGLDLGLGPIQRKCGQGRHLVVQQG
jgi:hypothetical protein